MSEAFALEEDFSEDKTEIAYYPDSLPFEAFHNTDTPFERFIPVETPKKGVLGNIEHKQDSLLRRQVAYRSLDHDTPEELEEIKLTAQLEHPGVMPVYTLEQKEGRTVGYAMKLIQGRTLSNSLNTPSKSPEAHLTHLIESLLKASDTLSYAHSREISHGRLSITDIVIGDFNEVYLLNWSAKSNFTPLDDLKEMGSILLEIAHQYPGKAELQHIAHAAKKGLYPNAEAFSSDLRAHIHDEETQAYPDSLWRKNQRWIRKNTQKALGIACLIIFAASSAIGWSLIRYQNTLKQSQLRRKILTHSLLETTRIAQKIDSQFSPYQEISAFLSGSIAESWQRGSQKKVTLPALRLPITEHNYLALSIQTTEKSAALKQLLYPLQYSFLNTQKQGRPTLKWSTFNLPSNTVLYPKAQNAQSILSDLNTQAPTPENHSTTWGKPFLYQGEYLQPLSQTIMDDQRASLGTLNLFILTQSLEKDFFSTQSQNSVNYWIIDSKHQTLYPRSPRALPQALKTQLQTEDSGYWIQKSSLYLYQPLNTGNWTLILEFDMHQIEQEVLNV